MDEMKVYNCCSGDLNPLRWEEIERLAYSHVNSFPFNDVVWHPSAPFKSSRALNSLADLLFQYFPALLLDLSARIAGKKPRMLKIYRKLAKASTSLEFFTTRDWKFSTTNTMNLHSSLSREDRALFSLDIREVNWPKYVGNYFSGIREYVLGEDLSTMPEARKHSRKMFFVHNLTQFLIVAILIFVSIVLVRHKF
jgi:fatty acyl-CoA reductase